VDRPAQRMTAARTRRGRAAAWALVLAAALTGRDARAELAAVPPAGDGASRAATLSVVSYNVHGLPSWIAFDDPRARMPEIARRLAGYDVALVQEDWWYPALLRGVASAFHVDVRAARSGLSLFARPGAGALLEHGADAYGVCAGWLGGANDCFADKGAQRARLRLANGAELELWNTHLDAGLGDEDQAARQAQLELLAARMERASAGRALVVAGDWNLDWDQPAHRALLDAFRARLGLEDAGARAAAPTRGAGYQGRIDHVFHRSAGGVSLHVLEAGEAKEFRIGETPLSDHPAVYVRYRVETRRTPDPEPTTRR